MFWFFMQQIAARHRYAEMAVRLHRLPVMLYQVDRFHIYEESAGLTPYIRDMGALINHMIQELSDPDFCPSPATLTAIEADTQLKEGIFSLLCQKVKAANPLPKKDEYSVDIGKNHGVLMIECLHYAKHFVKTVKHGIDNKIYYFNHKHQHLSLMDFVDRLDWSLAYFQGAVADERILFDHDKLLRQNCSAHGTLNEIVSSIITCVTVTGAVRLMDEPVSVSVPPARVRLAQLAKQYRSLCLLAEYHAQGIAHAFAGRMFSESGEGFRASLGVLQEQVKRLLTLLADGAYCPSSDWLDAAFLDTSRLSAKYGLLAEYIQFDPRSIYLYGKAPDRWSSYCLAFIGCLTRMEKLMEKLANEVVAGIAAGRCQFDSHLREAFADAGNGLDVSISLTHGLRFIRRMVLADLATSDVPCFSQLRQWASNMDSTVQGLAFLYIHRIELTDQMPALSTSDDPSALMARLQGPEWDYVVLH